MLTPEQVKESRAKFVERFIQKTIDYHAETLSGQTPDKNGFYDVGLPSSPGFTEDEEKQIRAGIEKSLKEAGWVYTRTHLIFSYKLKPLAESHWSLHL